MFTRLPEYQHARHSLGFGWIGRCETHESKNRRALSKVLQKNIFGKLVNVWAKKNEWTPSFLQVYELSLSIDAIIFYTNCFSREEHAKYLHVKLFPALLEVK